MPPEDMLREHPFDVFVHPGSGDHVWYDPDLDAFMRGPADGCDEAEEYATYAELLRS